MTAAAPPFTKPTFMKPAPFSSARHLALLGFALAASFLVGAEPPRPSGGDPTSPSKLVPGKAPVAPPGSPVRLGESGVMPTPAFNSMISSEDFSKYSAFQQQLNQDPAIKALNEKVSVHIREIQLLQAEANALRDKLISANPEIAAIRDKIAIAMRAHASNGPIPLPLPAKDAQGRPAKP